ncbi:hypothetical protein DFH06DRAFT_1026141, partial [Mycena polygramma]
LPNFIGPILQGINAITGMHATLIVGGPVPAMGGEISTLHYSYGRNKTALAQHWAQWDKPRFAHVQAFMIEYLKTAFTTEDCAQAALPTGPAAPDLSGAKYTIDGKAADDSDSDSDTDSDDSSDTDSDLGTDDEEERARTRKKRKLEALGPNTSKEKKSTKKVKKNTKNAASPGAPTASSSGASASSSGAAAPASSSGAAAAASSSSSPDGIVPPPTPSAPSSSGPEGAEDEGSASEAEEEATPALPWKPLGPPTRRSQRHAKDSELSTADVDMPAPPADGISIATNDSMDVDGSSTTPPAASSSLPATAFPPSSVTATASDGPTTATALPPLSQAVQIHVATRATLVPCPKDASPWFVSAREQMIGINLGCHFDTLLAAWTRIEYASRFENGPTNLSAKRRPKQVGNWINAGRGKRPADVAIPDHAAYATGWQVWWDSLQPAWRKRDKDGKWSTEGGYGKDGTDWGPLYQWGVNGVLNLIASLYFWGSSLVSGGEMDLRVWETAVFDVTWMMEGMAVYYERFNRKF